MVEKVGNRSESTSSKLSWKAWTFLWVILALLTLPLCMTFIYLFCGGRGTLGKTAQTGLISALCTGKWDTCIISIFVATFHRAMNPKYTQFTPQPVELRQLDQNEETPPVSPCVKDIHEMSSSFLWLLLSFFSMFSPAALVVALASATFISSPNPAVLMGPD